MNILALLKGSVDGQSTKLSPLGKLIYNKGCAIIKSKWTSDVVSSLYSG